MAQRKYACDEQMLIYIFIHRRSHSVIIKMEKNIQRDQTSFIYHS